MHANENAMVMPKNYVDMSAPEMEYDGGFKWNVGSIASIAVAVAGVAMLATAAFVAPGVTASALGLGGVSLTIGGLISAEAFGGNFFGNTDYENDC